MWTENGVTWTERCNEYYIIICKDMFLSTNIPGHLFIRYRGSFLGLKRPGHEVNHSPPFSANVKNEWTDTTTPLYAFV
jgi:hypothetical protein